MPKAPSVGILGFRPHTYWTAAVALAGPASAPRVLGRRRMVFASGHERHVFHQAETIPPASAMAMITRVRGITEGHAARDIVAFVADLKREGVSVELGATAASAAKVPEALEDILKSHSRMHAAEGNFYRDVVASACAFAGLEVRRAVERELPALVGEHVGLDPAALQARLTAMGRELGPPWSEDYKLATLAAWLQL